MRLKEIAVAFDQLVNAIFGGYADETISARCWRLRAERPYSGLRQVIDWIFFWQPSHCQGAYEAERKRSQLPAEYRGTTSPNPLRRVFLRPSKGKDEPS
jgi:hypothetical protein